MTRSRLRAVFLRPEKSLGSHAQQQPSRDHHSFFWPAYQAVRPSPLGSMSLQSVDVCIGVHICVFQRASAEGFSCNITEPWRVASASFNMDCSCASWDFLLSLAAYSSNTK